MVNCPHCSAAMAGDAGRCEVCGFTAAGNVLVDQHPGETVRDVVQRVVGERHRLRAALGYGEHSVVYAAEQGGPGRVVALKVLPMEGGVDTARAERFRERVNAIRHLYHPHILPVYESGGDATLLWYTMELAKTTTLADILRERGPLPTDVCVTLILQVAAALDHARRQRAVHGNLKPGNIFFDQHRHAMVADFAMLDGVDAPRTPGRRAFTHPEYLAPEVQESGGADASADQYALAVIAYQCLAGAPPFLGDSRDEVVRRQLTERPAALDTVRPDVPVEMALAVDRALSRYPAERFLSVQDFATALSGGVGTWQAPTVPPRPSRPSGGMARPAVLPAEPVRRPARRGFRAVGVVLALLTLAGVGTYGLLLREDTPSAAGWETWEPGPELRLRVPTRSETPPVEPTPSAEPAARAPVAATPAAPVEPAYLYVNARPWGRVSLNGTAIGETPLARLALLPGTHRLLVEREGFAPFDTVITVRAGEELRLTGIVLAALP